MKKILWLMVSAIIECGFLSQSMAFAIDPIADDGTRVWYSVKELLEKGNEADAHIKQLLEGIKNAPMLITDINLLNGGNLEMALNTFSNDTAVKFKVAWSSDIMQQSPYILEEDNIGTLEHLHVLYNGAVEDDLTVDGSKIILSNLDIDKNEFSKIIYFVETASGRHFLDSIEFTGCRYSSEYKLELGCELAIADDRNIKYFPNVKEINESDVGIIENDNEDLEIEDKNNDGEHGTGNIVEEEKGMIEDYEYNNLEEIKESNMQWVVISEQEERNDLIDDEKENNGQDIYLDDAISQLTIGDDLNKDIMTNSKKDVLAGNNVGIGAKILGEGVKNDCVDIINNTFFGYLWWAIVLFIVIDAIIMWWFWPKNNRK